MSQQRPPPKLTPKQKAIADAEWPKFTDDEMIRRRQAMETLLASQNISHLLLYGAGGRGSAVPWLTGWPVTTEVISIVSPNERDSLFIQYFNHTPFAERLMDEAVVNWGGESTIQSAIQELKSRGAENAKIGVIGALPFGSYEVLKGFHWGNY